MHVVVVDKRSQFLKDCCTGSLELLRIPLKHRDHGFEGVQMNRPLGFVEEVEHPGDQESQVLHWDKLPSQRSLVAGNLGYRFEGCVSAHVGRESIIVYLDDLADLVGLQRGISN